MRHLLAAALLAIATVTVAAQSPQVSFEDTAARLRLPDPAARMTALRLLEQSGYVEAGVPIAALLKDPDHAIQRQAVYAELGLFLRTRFEPRRYVAFVVEKRDADPAQRTFDSPWASLPIAPVPDAVVAGLAGTIAHPDTAFRIEAIYVLGLLGQVDGKAPSPAQGEALGALAERLGDTVVEVRVAAARAGGRMFRRCQAPCEAPMLSRFADALVHLLNDPDRRVRLAALEGLSDLRWERAIQSLTQAYEYFRKGDEAYAYLATLARIGHPNSVPVFEAALQRKEDAFRMAAAAGLARVSRERAASVASALASESSRDVQLAVAFANARSGQASGGVDRLLAALDSPATRRQAQDFLVELGPGVAGAAASALAAGSADAKVATLEVIGAVGGSAQRAAVDRLAGDRDARVAAAAERAALRLR